jgi:hypothetical protein
MVVGAGVPAHLSMFAGVVALSLLVLFVNPQPEQPPIVVVLNSTTSPADGFGEPDRFVASTRRQPAIVTRPLMSVSVQPDRALELWAVPSRCAALLGLISASGPASSGRQAYRRAGRQSGTAYGSTTSPGGPVLYVGKLACRPAQPGPPGRLGPCCVSHRRNVGIVRSSDRFRHTSVVRLEHAKVEPSPKALCTRGGRPSARSAPGDREAMPVPSITLRWCDRR